MCKVSWFGRVSRSLLCLFVVALLSIYGLFVVPTFIDDAVSPWEEVRLSFISLQRAESQCVRQPRADIVVTLTTLPKRIDVIHRTLKTILLGTACPRQILVWVPTYNRRLNQSYVFPDWLVQYNASSELVRVFRVWQDLGPATKLLAALQKRSELGLASDQRLMVIDDDVLYSRTLVETLDCYSNAMPDVAVGTTGCRTDSEAGYAPGCAFGEHIRSIEPVQVLFGTASFVIRPRFFNLRLIDTFSQWAPKEARFEDDWFFATAMAKQGVPRAVIPIDRRQLVQIDTLWSNRGDLMNTDNGDNRNWHAMIAYYRATVGNSTAWMVNPRTLTDRWVSNCSQKRRRRL